MNKKVTYIIIALIFILSFRFFSALFYPLLNSDNAVTILMIHYFKLPGDLYFWDQDRMGSIIPLIGQIPNKLFNISAITTESIIHYFILLLGYLSFAHFLKSHFLKIVFAIIWFFPPLWMIDLTQFSFGIHYSLIAMACFLFAIYSKMNIQENLLYRHLILTLITLLLISSIWVSDMALVTVFLVLTTHFYFYIKKVTFTWQLLKKLELWYAVSGLILGYIFIHYAKFHAQKKQDYAVFNNFDVTWQTWVIFWNSIMNFFTFSVPEISTSIYAYLSVIVLILFFRKIKSIQLSETAKKLLLFFLLDAILLFGIILISKWTILNGVPRRYFTCTYISLTFSLLLLLDNLKHKHKYLNIFLLLTVLTGGLGAIYDLKFSSPKTLTPAIETSNEFKKLGEIGIISEYWNSYIISCASPTTIIATPHDTSWVVKNPSFVDEVFKQKNIYVIRDNWFDHFPDTINEFNRMLIKDGEEFRIGERNICKYDPQVSKP